MVKNRSHKTDNIPQIGCSSNSNTLAPCGHTPTLCFSCYETVVESSPRLYGVFTFVEKAISPCSRMESSSHRHATCHFYNARLSHITYGFLSFTFLTATLTLAPSLHVFKAIDTCDRITCVLLLARLSPPRWEGVFHVVRTSVEVFTLEKK